MSCFPSCKEILRGTESGYDSGIHAEIGGWLNPGMFSIGSREHSYKIILFLNKRGMTLDLNMTCLSIHLLNSWGPESVRWLMTTGKTEQAIKNLQKIAFINGKKDIAHNLTTEVLETSYNYL